MAHKTMTIDGMQYTIGQSHMVHKTMTIDGMQYTLVPMEVTPNKSEKKRKPDDEVVEHAPKKVSAYNIYVKDQRADVTNKLTELHMSKPSNKQVMQAIALRWNNLKDGAKKGDKDSVAKMLQYKTASDQANGSKKQKKEDSDTASVVSLVSKDSDDWYIHTKWYKKNIQTTDWRPGNPGRPPIWFIAGINGTAVKTVKKYNKMKKMAKSKEATSKEAESDSGSDSDSESD